METAKVNGNDNGQKILLFALSTCMWCKKTKRLLESLGVEFEFIFVDKLEGEEREEVMEMVKKHNPRCSFPTLCIDDHVVIGFKEDEIKEKVK